MTAKPSEALTPWVIYCHSVALPDGTVRRYIGQTRTSIHARWLAHVRSAKAISFGTTNRFHLAISRCGPKAWTHEELEICCSQWEADKAERKWIQKFGTTDPKKGFNLQPGGGGRKGREPKLDIKEDTPEEKTDRLAWVMSLGNVT